MSTTPKSWAAAGTLTADEYRAAGADEPARPHCASPGCGRPVYADTLCKVHADMAWYAAGAPAYSTPRRHRPV